MMNEGVGDETQRSLSTRRRGWHRMVGLRTVFRPVLYEVGLPETGRTNHVRS